MATVCRLLVKLLHELLVIQRLVGECVERVGVDEVIVLIL
jgi:hypothetical protein